MKEKGCRKVLTAALLSAFFCLCAPVQPVCLADGGAAAGTGLDDGESTSPVLEVMTLSDCGDSCPGHTARNDVRIVVLEGSHTVRMKDVIVLASGQAGVSAIELRPGTSLCLEFEGNNELYTDDAPGILLPVGASLVLDGKRSGSLDLFSSNPCIAGTNGSIGEMTLRKGDVYASSEQTPIVIGGGSLCISGGTLSARGRYHNAALSLNQGGLLLIEGGQLYAKSEGDCVLRNGGGEVVVFGGEISVEGGKISSYSIFADGPSSFSVLSGTMQATPGIRLEEDSGLVVSGGELICSGGEKGNGGCVTLLDRSSLFVAGGKATLTAAKEGSCALLIGDKAASAGVFSGEATIQGADRGVEIYAGEFLVAGGSLIAEGGKAGIEGSVSGCKGTMKMTGGSVTAQGQSALSTDVLSISNGILEATGSNGSGIMAHSLEILGGDITAKGGGKGHAGIAVTSECTALISGGTIHASAESGAGIGTDYDSFGAMTIRGGEIYAKGGDGGPGISVGGITKSGTLSILGGVIYAAGGDGAEGIGSRNKQATGEVAVSGGSVTCAGGQQAPAIGGGIRFSITDGRVCAVSGKKAEKAIDAVLEFTGGELSIDGALQTPQTSAIVEITGCTETCAGHLISGGTPVRVVSGSHRITLQNARITSETCAFMLESGASAELTLIGDNSLQSGPLCAGLQVAQSAVLSISADSTGSLTAAGGEGAAGIGHGSSMDCGTIVIGGGKVTARAGEGGTGIGAQKGFKSGPVTITGGEVAAASDDLGIHAYTHSGSDVTISGGSVRIVGVVDPAEGMGIYVDHGDIVLSGGEVQVSAGKGISCSDGDIRISGGEVFVTGETDGISVSFGDLIILGGYVEAYVNDNNCSAISVCLSGNLSISGGRIIAQGISAVDTLSIESGVIDTFSSAFFSSGALHGKSIIISGGEVTADGGRGQQPGIGCGDRGSIVISGGQVTAHGGNYNEGISGIREGRIEIYGGMVTADAASDASGIGGESDVVTISGGTVSANGASGCPGVGGTLIHTGGSLTENGVLRVL